MTTDESKESLKQRIKLARAEGLLIGVKEIIKIVDEVDKAGLLKLIDEVLGLLK